MSRHNFVVNAVWDDEANVFYCRSDIFGLHVEAKTFDEFRAVVLDVSDDLIAANHVRASDHWVSINRISKT